MKEAACTEMSVYEHIWGEARGAWRRMFFPSFEDFISSARELESDGVTVINKLEELLEKARFVNGE